MVKHMKMAVISAALIFPALALGADDTSGGDSAQVLAGKQGKACQTLLCLSDPTGKSLPECQKPLSDYYDMKPHKRPGFLASCPKVGG